MSNLPALPTDFTALFIVGLSFGFGVCSVSCLPLVGAYIIGNSRKSGDGCWALLSFACGRLFTASILGGICAGLGQAVVKSLETPLMTLISGIFTLLAGLFILVRPRCVHCRANNRAHTPPFYPGTGQSPGSLSALRSHDGCSGGIGLCFEGCGHGP